MRITRRNLLHAGMGAVASNALPSLASSQPEGTPFDHRTVVDLARNLAQAPFQPPPETPRALAALPFEQYRQIRYRKQEAVWGDSPTRFSIELFAPGYLYKDLVDIEIVESGRSRPFAINDDSFDVPSPPLARELGKAGKFAGFRLHYPINRPDYRDEFVVFQGASFFRGVSEGQGYGLWARGLALDVAEPKGEEFPLFRRFWIERPSAKAASIVVHALLDSKSVSGAYRFGIYPGRPTTMEVKAALFPRKRLKHAGIAPLTSMFLHGPHDPSAIDDYRPAVHNSEVLAMTRGNGELLVRPLLNPRELQIGAFVDENPKGFGLMQRNRNFAHFQDLGARFGARPSAWVAPAGDWGKGHVKLVEIPSDSETNDNIISYWQPEAELEPGRAHEFAYRLSWPNHYPRADVAARVIRSARSRRLSDRQPQMSIDWETRLRAADLTLEASATPGALSEAFLVDNEQAGGVRAFLAFDPGGEGLVELRAQLKHGGKPFGETWLFRWLAE